MAMTCEELLNRRHDSVPAILGPVVHSGLETSSSGSHSPAGRDDSAVLPVRRAVAEGAGTG